MGTLEPLRTRIRLISSASQILLLSAVLLTILTTSVAAVDSFDDVYLNTVFHMDRKALLSISKLTDEEFIVRMNNGLSMLPSGRSMNSDVFNGPVDEKLQAAPAIDAEWDKLVSNAPAMVNYMSALMVVASKRDFPFVIRSNLTFTEIKHPESFRTTLAQLSSSMYGALYQAHQNMYGIMLSMEQLPRHIKTAMQLVTAASPALIKAMLPLTIMSIERITNETLNRAQSTRDKFESLSKLLLEIIVLGQETNSVNEDIIKKMEEQFNQTVLQKKELEERIQIVQSRYNDARRDLQEARAHHATAVQSRFFFVPAVLISAGIFGCIFFCRSRRNYEAEATAAATEARMRIERAREAQERLQKAEVKHDELYRDITKHQDDLTSTIFKLASIDLKVATPREIQQVLIEALNQTAHLHTQWSQLTLFFSKLAIDAQSTGRVTMDEFIAVINIMPQFESSDRDFFVPLIAESVESIERDAHLLHMAAKMYYDVSSQYMMQQIAGVSQLLVLQTDVQREHHLAQLSNLTVKNSIEVKKLAEERSQLYHTHTKQRQIEYKEFIDHYQQNIAAA